MGANLANIIDTNIKLTDKELNTEQVCEHSAQKERHPGGTPEANQGKRR